MWKLKGEKLRRPIIPEKKKEEKKTVLKNIFKKTTKVQAKAFPGTAKPEEPQTAGEPLSANQEQSTEKEEESLD